MNTAKQLLTIDTSVLQLNGKIVRLGATPTTPPVGATATRTASGGTPPYRYYDAAISGIVDVDQDSGRIVSMKNGQTTIVAVDAAGHRASYVVQVSNVFELDSTPTYTVHHRAVQVATKFGGRVPTLEEWELLRSAYDGAPPVRDDRFPAWSTTSAGDNLFYTLVPNSGDVGTGPDLDEYVPGGPGLAQGCILYERFLAYNPALTDRSVDSTRSSLPAPTVPLAEGRLDPLRTRGSTRVDTLWPGIAMNDRVTLVCPGTNTEPYTDTRTVRDTNLTYFFVPDEPYITGNEGGWVSLEYSVDFAAGGNERSDPLVLNILTRELETPVITAVEDSTGPVPDGGITTDTMLTLWGTSTPHQVIEIVDDRGAFVDTIVVRDSGQWTVLVMGLAVGPHGIKARDFRRGEPESAVYHVTVAGTTPR